MLSIDEMSLGHKIGQLIFCGFDGLEMNDYIKSAIKDYKIGNVILFARNFSSAKQLFNLIKDLQRYSLEYNGNPLFIAIDQEGGSVTRLTKDVTFFPGNMAVSSLGDYSLAFKIGEFMGEELKALGVNINLAPVTNLSSNPDNPNIGSRGYSADPKVAGKYGSEFIKGLQKYIIGTNKHFPNLGSVNIDAHIGLCEFDGDIEELESVEMAASKALIDSGVKNLMTSHVICRAVDDVPGTLSYNMVTNILKNKFKYSGMVISDCMEMKALDYFCGTVQGCVRAIKAGVDMLLICHTYEKQTGAAVALKDAVNTKEISMDRVDDAVTKILKYKREYDVDSFLNSSFEYVEKVINCKEHRELAKRISSESITVVRNDGLFPIKDDEDVLFISTLPVTLVQVDEIISNYSIDALVKKSFPNAISRVIDVNPDKDTIDELVKSAKGKEKVIIFTYNAHLYKDQAKLVNEIMLINKNTAVVTMRNPFDIKEFKNVRTYVLAYEYTPLSVISVLEFLIGKINPKGQCPIELDM